MAFEGLAPHLSLSERRAAQKELWDLQEGWRGLQRSLERSLNQSKLYSEETSNLLSTVSGLQTHLETICRDVEVKHPDAAWSCRKATHVMVAGAEVKAAQQQHLQLQQLSDLLNSREVQEELQKVSDHLRHAEELVASSTQTSSNPIMEKISVVMKDGLTWAKQTECIIRSRQKKVALLPEEVHQQLRDLKKLQSEVAAKQGQLEALVEEVTELLPQLDQAEEVPVVTSALEMLQELSKSTTEGLTSAVRQVESGLQTREKLTEQMAELDSWVMAHLLREASRSTEEQLSPAELGQRSAQLQENLDQAQKQLCTCEALLLKMRDISPELSITENCRLFNKLSLLQEDLQAITKYQKVHQKVVNERVQIAASSNEGLATVERSLRQMLVDVGRLRFPVTKDSVQALEPWKLLVLEHKAQVDLLQPWVPQENVEELYSAVSDLLRNMAALERNSIDHESYLSERQRVEDLRENIQEQLRQTREDGVNQEERYKLCQALILQIPLVKALSEEARQKLQKISASLYPSQLTAEQQRLKLQKESLETLEMTLHNNLSILERDALQDLDLDSEEKATLAFFQSIQEELEMGLTLELHDAVAQKEQQRLMTLRMTVEARMRALEFLQKKKGPSLEGDFQNVMELKNQIISECDSQMVSSSSR